MKSNCLSKFREFAAYQIKKEEKFFTTYTGVCSIHGGSFLKSALLEQVAFIPIHIPLATLLLQSLPSSFFSPTFQSFSCKIWSFFLYQGYIKAFLGSHLLMLIVVAVLSVSLNNKNRFPYIVNEHSHVHRCPFPLRMKILLGTSFSSSTQCR